MDCSENENVCSVKKENNLGYYRIHTVWNDNGFRVNIASRDGAWTGEMKPENIRNMSSELKVDPEKYLAECKEVLTTDDGKKGYFYSVENGSFTWKKMIDEDSGMKIRMGSVIVQPVSFVDTIQNIIEVALNCKKNLNKQLNSLKQEKKRDVQRISQFQEQLEEICNKKNKMEADLYSKFLLILNSKKRKIEELESPKLSIKENYEKLNETNHSKSRIKKKVEEKNIIEAYEMDTEDEDDCMEKGNVKSPCEMSSAKEKGSDDLLMNDCISEIVDSTLNTCMASDGNSRESTPDLDVTCLSSSIPGTSNENNNSSSCEIIKNKNKSFPDTKADILDFFFGPTG